MNWLEITITTAPAGIDQVVSDLTAGGFSDLIIEDQVEFETFLEENRGCWDYIDEELQEKLNGLSQIKLYLEDTDTKGLARLKELVETIKNRHPNGELGALEIAVATLPQTNWEESWKENYPPQEIGNKLVVLPYWLSDTDTAGRLPVILDPGLTFGTGAHPSTQMVIAAMESLPLADATCIDLGSGSGILSIAALRLGAKSAIGIDIDPKGEDIARTNAAFNGFEAPTFTAFTGNLLTDEKLMAQLNARQYDLVLVNIVADVIIALAPKLPGLLKETGTVICSGILNTRLNDVLTALNKAGLTVTQTYEKEEWRCVCAKR